jgi:CheY-like chemotaxis protein
MPKMNGSEFITALKSKEETAQIPVFLVAGKHGDSTKEKRADLKIFKDIEIEEQLAKALKTTFGSQAKAHAAAK